MRSPVGWASTPLRRLRSDLKDPLLRNGYALLLNVGVTSALGFLYWIVAARTYTAVHVGLSSTAVAVVQFLAGLAGQPSIANALTRFLPRAGPDATRLTVLAYGVAAGAGALVSALYVAATYLPLGVPVVLGQSWILALALGASVVIWCVFALQDAALTGVRQAVWVPLENGLYGIGKIALLVALAPVTPEYGIVVSWFLPALVLLPPVNVLIFRRLLRRHPAAPTPGHHDRRTVARFIGGDYLGSIFALAAVDLLPVLVVARLGAAATAYFYLPFLIVYSIELVAVNLGVSLTVEGALDRSRLAQVASSVLRRIGLIVVPAVLVLLLVPGLVLSVYGPAYAAQSSDLLRLLALGVLAKTVTTISFSLARVERRVSRIALVQAVLFVLLMALSWALMGTMGLNGVGLAYLITQVVVAAAVLPSVLRMLRHHRA
jgi:O-antigen/teichoic acid export membrane protein